MKIKLGQIINYAYTSKEKLILEALKKFFGDDPLIQEKLSDKTINGLFNEWLIFDFKLSNGTSIAGEYYLKNPDNLDQSLLNELEQILSTQFYDLLEIMEVKQGEWIKLYSFKKGVIIKVWDIAGSSSAVDKTTLTGRVAKINGRWYLVGSNGVQLPFNSTPRHKRIMRQAKGDSIFTPKDTLNFLTNISLKQSGGPKTYTKKEIKNKRVKLEKKFNKLTKKFNFKLDFKKMVEFVYNENYQSNHADMFKDFVKLGVPEKVFIDSLSLFQDILNFFPHKKLKGKCPAEM